MGNQEKTLEQLKAEMEEARKAYELAQKAAKQKEAEEAERKKAELAAIKQKRKREIEDVEKKLEELYRAYLRDYGVIEWSRSTSDDNWLGRFFKHYFLF